MVIEAAVAPAGRCRSILHLPFGLLQALQKSLKAPIVFFFRMALEVPHRSADMQVVVRPIRPVPRDIVHRFPYMSRRNLHFPPTTPGRVEGSCPPAHRPLFPPISGFLG
jgi:hypothetical protein